MPQVQKIFVFPIKSLEGVEVKTARITSGGTLRHDREFAIFDSEGKTVNGKKYPAIHQIRNQFDLENRQVTLTVGNSSQAFHLDAERELLNEWFSKYFKLKTELRQNQHTGFPDDTEASGPTIISEATLSAIQSWFPKNGMDNIRRRFRANIVLGNCDVPFWEDRLYGKPGGHRPFKIGEVAFKGINPCQRCAVPSRDPLTGEVDQAFQHRFKELREANLPAFAERSHFNHFYRLSVNTMVGPPDAGKWVSVDDLVTL